LFANEERRSRLKTIDSNISSSLIPGIEVEYRIRDIEVIIVEQANTKPFKKKVGDTLKLCMYLHDMIRRIYEELPSYKKDEIRNIKVFGLLVSGKTFIME